MQIKSDKEYTLIDLFSCCGGFSLGFKKAGFKLILANDKWSTANKTFEKNFPSTRLIKGDITKVEIQKEICSDYENQIDVIIGGPPCQAYSLAGCRGPEDPRGKLFTSYVDIVEKIQPKVFVLENVKGILSMKHFREETPLETKKKTLETIKRRRAKKSKVSIETLNNHIEENLIPVTDLITKTFKKIDYDVKFKVLNAADYGVPQRRLRVFFIGAKTNIKIRFPKTTHSNKQTLDNLKPYVSLKETIGDLPFPDIREDDEVYSGGFSYIYMSRNRRKKWDEVSFTIQAGQRHIPLHPASPPMIYVKKDEWKFGDGPQRRLSVRECARIQTFPDDFEFLGGTSNKYKQIGNAVPPLLANKIARAVKNMI